MQAANMKCLSIYSQYILTAQSCITLPSEKIDKVIHLNGAERENSSPFGGNKYTYSKFFFFFFRSVLEMERTIKMKLGIKDISLHYVLPSML